jgi:methionyl-tRNA formyltransferase
MQSNNLKPTTSPRIALFGMRCQFTEGVLSSASAAGLPISLVIFPRSEQNDAPKRPANRAKPVIALSQIDAKGEPRNGFAQLAHVHPLSTVEVTKSDLGEIPRQLSAESFDLVVVACFPWLLPQNVISWPRLASLNVHPSLLPKYRGPEPLFWTFQKGDRESGVTIHALDGRYDAGPILVQRPMTIPLESQYEDIEARLASLGGRLLAQTVGALRGTNVVKRSQDESTATLAPFPSDDDLVISPEWNAERAYRFARGVGCRFGQLWIGDGKGRRDPIVDAVGLFRDRPAGSIIGPHRLVEFSDGYVTFVTAGAVRSSA